MLLRRSPLLFVLLMFSSFVFAAQKKTKAVYCMQAANGAWKLQRFEPLINPRAGTVFTELSFAGTMLEAARLRRFYPDREVVFDYKFDGGGRLTALVGSVELWGQWLGEANLYPEADGRVSNLSVKYYRASSRDRINRPEEADAYTGELSRVPIYRTIESLPCGGSLQEAEKMNATQE
jgi:hypothetical protein